MLRFNAGGPAPLRPVQAPIHPHPLHRFWHTPMKPVHRACSFPARSRTLCRSLCACGLGLLLTSANLPQGWAQPSGLPNLGAASGLELSPLLERTLGEAIMEQGRRDPTYIADAQVNQYLTALGHRLVAAAPAGSGQDITVFAVRDAQINAFALPGGYVGIHSGLLVAAESESELAGVLAHEIGHVLQRHVARGMTQQARSSHLMMASVAAALLAALAGSGDLAMGVASFGQAAAIDQQLGFSRQAEQEADRIGMDMLRRAGFDPLGMVRTFGRLMNLSRLNEGSGAVYASTHPLSIQRMSDMENRARNLQLSASGHQDSADFWFVRAKLRIMQARASSNLGNNMGYALAELERETTLDAVRASAAWYGLAYAAMQRSDWVKAQDHLRRAGWKDGTSRAETRAVSNSPSPNSPPALPYAAEHPPVANLAASLLLKQEQWDAALALSREAVRLWPDDLESALTRTDALQATGQHDEAVKFLAQALLRWPQEARLYQLQAISFERLQQGVQARRAMAAYYEKMGALPAAVEQLRQARAMSRDFYTQTQLDVHIRQLQETLMENRALLERFR